MTCECHIDTFTVPDGKRQVCHVCRRPKRDVAAEQIARDCRETRRRMRECPACGGLGARYVRAKPCPWCGSGRREALDELTRLSQEAGDYD